MTIASLFGQQQSAAKTAKLLVNHRVIVHRSNCALIHRLLVATAVYWFSPVLCQRRMTYIGQVTMEDVYMLHEGITYAFLCAGCGKAATTYQQT